MPNEHKSFKKSKIFIASMILKNGSPMAERSRSHAVKELLSNFFRAMLQPMLRSLRDGQRERLIFLFNSV